LFDGPSVTRSNDYF